MNSISKVCMHRSRILRPRTSIYGYLSTLINPTIAVRCASVSSRRISHSYPRYEAKKKQSSATPHTFAITTVNHQPPLPVRIALVSTTTALATPAFPALGFLYLVLRVTIPDANLRKAMENRWGSLLSLTTWTLLPNLYHGTVASLILPCAIGNGVVAGGVYGLVDFAFGGPSSSSQSLNKILQIPWITGSGIGATVGFVAPTYFYGPIMEILYSLEGMSQSMTYVMSFPFATEVSVATGAVAGMLLYPLLYYPMHGMPGMQWQYFSGSALAAATAALVYVYYGRKEVGLPVPVGSYISPSDQALVDSILRYNNTSGQVETYSLYKQQFIGLKDKCLESKQIAEAGRSYSQSGKKAIFDDRILAFVYNFWDEKTKSRYPEHVLKIKSKQDLKQTQQSMALTDASVVVILHGEEHDRTESSSDLMKILKTIDELNEEGRKQLSPKFKSLKDVCVAIELLMIVKKQSKQDHSSIGISIPTLEQFIRKRCPELTLYISDEKYEGESVESQLQNANWSGSGLPIALNRWKKVHEKETYRTWRNCATLLVLVSITASLLQVSR